MGAGSINGGLFDSNYIVHNNIDQVLRGFEGVGTKFTGDNLTISNNIVHDNLGNGLSTDSNASYNSYIHNTTYNNLGCGIVYETSRYGTIENNTVYGNTTCGGIIYAGSDHGRISGNTVTDDGLGGIKVYNIVGTRALQATYQVTDTQVTGNTIAVASVPGDIASGLIDGANPAEPSIFTDPTNIWANNTYLVSSLPWVGKSWAWGENNGKVNPIDWNTWISIHPVGEQLQLQ
jgi:parallel beta-helix repeat protein